MGWSAGKPGGEVGGELAGAGGVADEAPTGARGLSKCDEAQPNCQLPDGPFPDGDLPRRGGRKLAPACAVGFIERRQRHPPQAPLRVRAVKKELGSIRRGDAGRLYQTLEYPIPSLQRVLRLR